MRSGRIRIAARRAPTLYYHGQNGLAGFEHEKASAFAADFGLSVEFLEFDTQLEVIEAVDQGRAHIGVGGLFRANTASDGVVFVGGYEPASLQLVCHRQIRKPRKIADLDGLDLRIVAGLGYETSLTDLQKENSKIRWTSDYGVSVEELIRRVAAREIDCTLTDSHTAAVSQRLYPELYVTFNVGEPSELAWVFSKKAKRLHDAYSHWLKRFEKSGEMPRLRERYFHHYQGFDYVEIRIFHRRIVSELPKYRHYFEKEAKKIGVTWTLLAAQSYQESHWNPQARSPTGVLGMMMLTRRTATAMGLSNRTSVQGSIAGGARYLKKMLDQVPLNVAENEKVWFALAAYNVGMGHIHDAQGLAHELGYNPYQWKDIKKVLPLLSQKKYYSRLKYGYARGMEPVVYVKRIREYKDILDHVFKPHLKKLSPDDVIIPLANPVLE